MEKLTINSINKATIDHYLTQIKEYSYDSAQQINLLSDIESLISFKSSMYPFFNDILKLTSFISEKALVVFLNIIFAIFYQSPEFEPQISQILSQILLKNSEICPIDLLISNFLRESEISNFLIWSNFLCFFSEKILKISKND